jgi:copper resistance protein C
MTAVFLESRRRRRLVRITVWAAILGLLLGVLSSLALAVGADAHASLRSVSPADGARLTQAPTQVVLTFDEPVSTSFVTVTVTNAAGDSVSAGRAAVTDAVVTQRLTAGLASGTYTVAFRVVSDDGHPVSDRTTFTLALPGAGSGAPASGPAPTMTPLTSPTGAADPSGTDPAASGPPADDNTSLRLGLAVGLGALALAAGTALVALSRRSSAR